MRRTPHFQIARPTIPGPSPFLFALILNFAAWGVLITVMIRTFSGGGS